MFIDALFSGLSTSEHLNMVPSYLIERLIERFPSSNDSYRASSVCYLVMQHNEEKWSENILNFNKVIGKVPILSVIVIALMFTILPEYNLSASLLKSGGHPTPNFTVSNYSYNSTWQTPMNNAIYDWNGTPTRARISKSSSSRNTVTAAKYSWSDYGRYYHYNHNDKRFRIQLNSRTISRDATNISNFIRGVFAHELGHALWLADNPSTSSASIMKYSNNMNRNYKPTTYDINNVKRQFP